LPMFELGDLDRAPSLGGSEPGEGGYGKFLSIRLLDWDPISRNGTRNWAIR
jgi:hypothetical protein